MGIKYFQGRFFKNLLAHSVKEQEAMKKPDSTTSLPGKVPNEAICVLLRSEAAESHMINKWIAGSLSAFIMHEKN